MIAVMSVLSLALPPSPSKGGGTNTKDGGIFASQNIHGVANISYRNIISGEVNDKDGMS